jgi:short subunit dehydrogenase
MRHEFEVNVIGPLLLTQGIAKQMVKRGKGRIVWVSSREGLNVNPFTGIYSSSKHAVEAVVSRLHEITRSHTARSGGFRASRRSVSWLHPDTFFLSPPRLTSPINSSLHRCADSSSTGLNRPANFDTPSLAPFNLHNSRVRRASGFLLTAFSNATPHTFF